MTVFEKNRESLVPKEPALFEGLEGRISVEMEEARSGGSTFRHKGIYFHSRYNPRNEAALQAEELAGKKPDWVFLFGLGCGHLMNALIEKGLKKVIVFEPSLEILKGVLENIDLSGAFSEEKVFLTAEMHSAIEKLRSETEGFDSLLVYSTTPYKSAFPDELADFTNRIHNAHITNQVGIKTDMKSRGAWIENYLSNLKSLPSAPPIDVLRGAFKGVPMIIAGAGPSLKKNGELLKEFKGKAIIVAAITSYKPLLKLGVVPDFVIASEMVDLPEYFTFGEDDKKTRLILGELSHPNMFERDVKGKFVFFSPYLALSSSQAGLWGSSYFPAIGGSVTTAALDMGIMFGCNPITFIGQDLSFGENETHAPGGVYVAQNVRIDRENGMITVEDEYINDKQTYSYKLQWLKGLSGKPVPSKYDWATFHQWFENYMHYLKKEKPEVRVINATEGGAYIEGMEHTTLRRVLDTCLNGELAIDEAIDGAVASRPRIDYTALVASFRETAVVLNRVNRLSASILKEAAEAKKTYGKKGLTADLKGNIDRIKRLEESIFDESDRAKFIWEALINNTYALKEYLKKETDDKAGEGAQFLRDLETVIASYKSMTEACQRFGCRFEEAAVAIREAGARAEKRLMAAGL